MTIYVTSNMCLIVMKKYGRMQEILMVLKKLDFLYVKLIFYIFW